MREKVILPLRGDMPRLLRFHRAAERLASWCSWSCPLVSFLLLIAAHAFSAPFWWRAVCDSVVASLFALLFFSYGFSLASASILVKRPPNWFERLGLAAGIFGGVAFAALGITAAWIFFRKSVLGS